MDGWILVGVERAGRWNAGGRWEEGGHGGDIEDWSLVGSGWGTGAAPCHMYKTGVYSFCVASL